MNVAITSDLPRVGFVSTVGIGVACIDEIHKIGGRLSLIVTLDDAADRHKSGRANLAESATLHGCDLLKVRNINDTEAVEAVQAARLNWLFIIGWSQIAKPEVLSIPSNGVIGAHPTLLPVGRGRAPIPWAILKGLPETGVTFFMIDEGVDTGPIIAQEGIPIESSEDAGTLYDKAVVTHRRLIGKVWRQLTGGTVQTHQQDEANATYWPKRTPADGKIHSTMSVEEIDRLVRAVTHPYPGAFISREGARIRVWKGTTNAPPEQGSSIAVAAADGTWWATDFEIERSGNP